MTQKSINYSINKKPNINELSNFLEKVFGVLDPKSNKF